MSRSLSIGVSAAAWVRRALRERSGRVVLAWALLYWVGDLLSIGGALFAYGFTSIMAGLTVAYTTGYVARIVPIPFGATGGVDVATIFTLTMVGVPAGGNLARCDDPPRVRLLATDWRGPLVGLLDRALVPRLRPTALAQGLSDGGGLGV